MTATTLREITEEIAAKNDRLHQVFQQAKIDGSNALDLSKVTIMDGDTWAKAAEIKRLNEELTELGEKRDILAVAEQAKQATEERRRFLHEPAPGAIVFPNGGSTQRGADDGRSDFKGIRPLLDASPDLKAFQDNPRGEVRVPLGVDAKTLVTLTTISPQTQRLDMRPMIREERTVVDLMVEGTIDSNTLEYYEQTGFTNAAVEVAEAGTKPESALAWTLRTGTVRDIAHWLPVTRQALRDNGFLETQIRGELVFGIRRREERQVLIGDGSAPNLRGIVNTSGIQTQAKGADPTPDAIYKAMQLIRGSAGTGFAEPTGVVLHPADWTDIKLLRTADGIYIWGSPSDEGPDRIWSLPVRQTTEMTQNTGLVGAFRPYAQVLRRTGIEIILSTEHSTYVIENKVLLLAEEAIAFLVTRASAFATVTGI